MNIRQERLGLGARHGGALVLLALLAGCAAPSPEPATQEPRPVRVAVAADASSFGEQVYSGVVRAAVRTRVSFQVPGRLTGQPLDIGAELRKGQLVARLDDADFRLRAERAQASLSRAQAQQIRAAADFRRVEALYADDNATRGDFDAAEAALESTRSAVVEAESALELARRDLGYTRLVASADQRIVEVLAEPGEVLTAGQPIAVVIDGGALELEWQVPEAAVGRMRIGLEVEALLPALGRSLTASVVELGSAPRGGGATFPVVARLSDADGAEMASVLPGMAADVRLRFDSGGSDKANAVLVPPEAVAGDPNGAFVFVVDGDTVNRRAVELGTLGPGGLEITAGLAAGETVVSAGVPFLDDGQRVQSLRGDPLAELPSTAPKTGASMNQAPETEAER